MARFYLDENIDTAVGRTLARSGHDVVHAYDLGNRSTPDSQHLWVAANDGRVLITFNRRDFEQLHRFWLALNTWEIFNRVHAGIITSWGKIPRDQWADLVHEFVRPSQNLDNQMWEWRPRQQEWTPYGW